MIQKEQIANKPDEQTLVVFKASYSKVVNLYEFLKLTFV